MDFLNHTVLTCDSEYQVTSAAYSSGVLELTVDYSKNMEGVACTLEIAYDSSVALVPGSALHFTAQGRNLPLIIVSAELADTAAQMVFTFKVLSYAGLSVFFLSLLHKMIGPEFVLACQLIFFSFALYPRPSFVAGSIRAFVLLTGFRSVLFSQEVGAGFSAFASAAQLGHQYLENALVLTCFLAAPGLLLLVLGVRKAREAKADEEEQKEKQSEEQKQRRWKGVLRAYNVSFFPFAAFALVLVLTFGFVSNQRIASTEGTAFPATLNSLCLLTGWTASASVVVFELVRSRPRDRGPSEVEVGGEAEMQPWYVLFFLGKIMLLSAVLSLYAAGPGEWVSFAVILLLGVSAVTLAVLQPYRNAFGNLAAIGYELVALYAMVLALLNRFVSLSEDTEVLLVFALEGLIAAAACLCLARTIRFYYQLCKSQKPEQRLFEGGEAKGRRVLKETALRAANANEGLLIE
jgi:hypothetical protein